MDSLETMLLWLFHWLIMAEQNPRNILGVTVHRDLETDIYKIAGKVGVLNGVLSRNQFDLCPQKLFPEEDVSPDKPVFAVSGHSADSVRGARVDEM